MDFCINTKRKVVTLLAILIGALNTTASNGQGTHPVELFLGIGFPEMYNGGVAIQLKQAQAMIGIGYIQFTSDDFLSEDRSTSAVTTLSTDILFHVAGKSTFNERKPFYLRTGIISCVSTENIIWLNARIGRELNFSESVGLALDLGTILEIYNSEGDSYSEYYSTSVLPAAGMRLFFRLSSSRK